MATKITVVLEDDLDGGPAKETVRFGLGGVQYEIDLSKKHARAFRKHLAPYVEHARKAGPGQWRRPARTAASRQRSVDIRAWAKARGLLVSDRGRIPASIVDQYQAATKRPLTPGHRRHEPARSDGRWPGRPVNGVPLGPPGCPPMPMSARSHPGYAGDPVVHDTRVIFIRICSSMADAWAYQPTQTTHHRPVRCST